MSIFLRHVEERCQHLNRQLVRDLVHPVEGFSAWQTVQDFNHAGSNFISELAQVSRCECRLDHVPISRVVRRVHADKCCTRTFDDTADRLVLQPYATEVVLVGEHIGVLLDFDDIVVARNGPMVTSLGAFAEVNGILRPQMFEQGRVGLRLVQSWVGDIVGVLASNFGHEYAASVATNEASIPHSTKPAGNRATRNYPPCQVKPLV